MEPYLTDASISLKPKIKPAKMLQAHISWQADPAFEVNSQKATEFTEERDFERSPFGHGRFFIFGCH
ncbi:hypothetical protein ACFO5X_25605 [Seohaeicola nanhaiensis]|uniref:Uncharacterized protein n=1 Tax=Seohaeicola nanhaiensis TaxID=1387282 RepID=A0ABV9KPV6_9RHOB